MKISYNKLKELTNISLSAAEVADILTNTGLEVEHIEKYESIKGKLAGVVIGHVLEKQKHPNADKLSVCKVDIGSGIMQIVCGASNVAAGQKVLVATVGSTIYPNSGDSLTIQKVKIRGEVSEGMICAEDEIGLGSSHEGIMVLPEHYETGKPASDYFDVYTDEILEIGLTANRGDAAGHLGVARDIKAVTGCNIYLNEPVLPTKKKSEKNFKISILDTSGCKRYSGIYIEGVAIKPSPAWLQHFLLSIGLTPINNVVDATNYTLHVLGQPIHAFDADTIVNNEIVVQKVQAGSAFTTLDKITRKLNGEECMICDAEKPLAMAGIFGGLHSGITSATKNIFIESAYFDPATIRKAAKYHGLSTDASFRYERGTDPDITVFALKFVAVLILEMAGGEAVSDILDIYPEPVTGRQIAFSISKHQAILGADMPVETIKQILNRLDITITAENDDILQLNVPPYRTDVTRPIDVTEEILRIYGLNNIPVGHTIQSAITFSEFEFALNLKNKLATLLAADGFLEIATNSLTKAAFTKSANDNLLPVALLNPLSTDLEYLRTNMLYSMLEAIAYNNNRKQHNLNFFEFAKTYHLNGNEQLLSSYIEKKHLAVALYGNKQPESWNTNETPNDFFRLKQVAEKILRRCALNDFTYEFETDQFFEPFANITINKKTVARLGCVKQSVLKPFDLDKPVWFIDFDFDEIIKFAEKADFKLKPVSVFPSVRRDLALVLDKNVPYAELKRVAFQTEKKLLKDVNVFDVYEGDKIPEGKKSYALSFILQDDEKTLTDEVIDNTMKKLLKNFEKEFRAVLR